MDTIPGTVTVWQSGRLAPHAIAPRFDIARVTREQWLGAALLLMSAIVMAVYVSVLQRDVKASEMEHLAQRASAVAQARCEADQPAERPGHCQGRFNGDLAAVEPVPVASPAPGEVRYERENAARAMTVSLVGR